MAPTFTPSEHTRRWHALQRLLRDKGLSGAVVAYSRNVLYLAGMAVHGHVVVPTEGDPVLLAQIDSGRAGALSPVPTVLTSRGVGTLVEVLADLGVADGVLGVEHDFLTIAAHGKLQGRLPRARFVDVAPDLLALRSIKSPEEVAVLERAARLSDAQLLRVREIARPGVTEVELHVELGRLQRTEGADGFSAKHGPNDRLIEHAWVVSGPHTEQVSGYWLTMTGAGPSPARPYGPTSRVLQEGDLLCCDVGTAVAGYHVDHARSYVLGCPDDRQRRCWDALLEMQSRAIEAAVPGRPASDVYDAAHRVAQTLGFADHFMTRALYDVPYVGHGVGLEIDEGPLLTPDNRTVLQEGMVLAVEPKVIVPGWGGLTVEDTVVLTRYGAQRLTGVTTELELPV
ncbi:MAG TPA: Xaa-Pro peptidase family protein [Egibacteraceae bacterium]|nr:Xaa-Pro peptidase family protein [Egibacteraceae bacterium]